VKRKEGLDVPASERPQRFVVSAQQLVTIELQDPRLWATVLRRT
jgi:hypothetical protein